MTKKNSHTSALFHYTKNKNNLLSILKEGFKFSYCKEKYSEELCIGIPMICFCDIPISNSFELSSKYGQYAIALCKNKLIEDYCNLLGPVNYFASFNHVKAAFELLKEAESLRQEFDENGLYDLNDFFNIYSYKQYSNLAISLMKPYYSIYKGKNQINYDECEWRLVLPENVKLSDNKSCKWFWNETTYDNWRKKQENKFINELLIKFSVNDIEYIIVSQKASISNFIKSLIKLKTICGKELTDNDKYTLVSKVISLDQIKKDF